MDKHRYKQSAYYLMYLVRCVLKNKIPAKEKLEKIDLNDLFTVADDHSMTAIAAYALESAGIFDRQFEDARNKAIRKSILFDAERSRILNELEKNGIWYMPLKGSIMKEYYPKIGMRQMADNDNLFDMSRRDDVRKIMSGFGYELKAAREAVDEYLKEPVYNIEMHGELFMKYQVGDMADYYRVITSRMLKDEDNGYGYHLSDEEFYLFMIAHEYKHFSLGGTGIRSLIDTYVVLDRFGDSLDWEYLSRELENLGIAEFERNNRELAMAIMGEETPETEEKELLDRYIFAGTYGTFEQSVKNKLEKNSGSRFRYWMGRIFMPMDTVKREFPFYYKHKYLLPILYLKRIGFLFTVSRKKVIKEIHTVNDSKK